MKTNRVSIRGITTDSLLLVLLLSLPAYLDTWDVHADPGLLYVAPEGNCGGVVTPCYASVQAAVDAAMAGDEIRVATGTYTGVNSYGGLSQMVYIDRNITIKGGYTITDWDTPDPDVNVTTLNALAQGRVVFISGAYTVAIEGLYLEYGDSTDLGNECGGGIYADGASLTLRESWLLYNVTPGDEMGGGIYFKNGMLTIESSTIQENASGSGGGIRILSSEVSIQGSDIIDNVADAGDSFAVGGGGVAIGGTSQVSMIGNLIHGNENSFLSSGGGIALADLTGSYTGIMDLYLHDNSIEENYSGDGGGISIRDGYVNNLFITATIIDNTIQYNKVYGNGAGIFSSSADVTIQNNTIINNHAGVNKEETMTEYGDGGGVHISGQALIENNLIQSNWAKAITGQGTGGGVYLNGNDSIVFRHNQVIGNLVVGVLGGRGGGVYITNDHVLLESNLIQNNSANGGTDFSGGGGIHIYNGDVTLNNNIITDNAVSPEVNFGSGITIRGCSPTLIHNTIANNTGGGGHGVYITNEADPGQPAFYNTIIASQTVGVNVDTDPATNMASLDGILWYGNTSDTIGNVFTFHVTTGDPLFVNPASLDYHISVGSAAIDHGIVTDVIKDYDGEPRFVTSDLGADEYWAPGVLKYFFLPLLVK